jgi:single-strand DNA-binding protein
MNFNKAFILGNLTRDPEIRQIPSGKQIATFGVATNRFYIDGSGQRQQQTEFHNVVAWGKLADICGQYLAKGRLVFIEGRIQTRSWQDQSGQTKYRTEVIAESIQMGPRLDREAPVSSAPESGEPQKAGESEAAIPVINYPEDEGEIQVKDIPF